MTIYAMLQADEDIRTYIRAADDSLRALGFTEHSFAHVTRVAEQAGALLQALGYDAHTVDLAQSAGYLHDLGNLVNRVDHSQSGALIAYRILSQKGLPAADIATIVTAIGNHDEGTGVAVNPVAAALILSDKCDVRRSRVRNTDSTTFDIHDRVNYSVTEAALSLAPEEKALTLTLSIDTVISPVMDYFEIFLKRMTMCRRAAEALGLSFRLVINGQRLF